MNEGNFTVVGEKEEKKKKKKKKSLVALHIIVRFKVSGSYG